MVHTNTNILHLLKCVLSGNARETDVDALVKKAYQFSHTRLKQLINSGKLHLGSFQLTIEGIAFDCIAEIFQRNEEGIFIDLVDYFSGERDLELLDEAGA